MLKRLIFSLFLFILGFVLLFFEFSEIFSKAAFLLAFLLSGYSVIVNAFKSLANIFKGRFKEIFDENVLMSVACFGALGLGEWAEAAAIMVFYMIGECFNDYALTSSKDKISALLKLRPRSARVLVGEQKIELPVADVKIGNIIELRAGERVGLDSVIIWGSAFVDTAAITGESRPRELKVGDSLLAGFIVLDGVLKAQVKACESDSALAKISELVAHASANKSPHEKFISTFARLYTPIVVGLAAVIAFVAPLIFGGGFGLWANRALIFLVISCPCALVISVPLAFFAGIGAASKAGILVRSSQVLSTLSSLKTCIFDKTGTLTKGVFKLNSVCSKSLGNDEFIAHAAHATSHSNHPVAKSLSTAHKQIAPNCELCKENTAQSKELSGLGVSTNQGSNELLAGNAKLMKDFGVAGFECECEHAGTLLHLALNREYKGHALLGDELKTGAKELILAFKAAGITPVMLSGDNEKSVSSTACELGIERFSAGLLPAQKLELLESQLGNGAVAFVGDGINDAAALARADVGIAINAQDAAVEAADVVILNQDISALNTALKIAKRTKAIAWENILFALGSKGVIMVLGSLGLAGIWAAVFADVGVSLLCVLNAMRASKTL